MHSDGYIFWPEWMPAPQEDSWSFQPEDLRGATETEVGAIVRPQFDSDILLADCTLVLNHMQSLWFESFEKMANQENLWFVMPVWYGGDLRDGRVMFKDRPKWTVEALTTTYKFTLLVQKRSLECWWKTEKAGIVSFCPAGGSQIKATVDFRFAETPPAEGEKSPSNPSTIAGVSTVNVGWGNKNLFHNAHSSGMGGAAASISADGTVTINGTTTSVGLVTAWLPFLPTGFSGLRLTFSVNNPVADSHVQFRWGGSSGLWVVDEINKKKTVSFSGSVPRQFQIRCPSGNTYDNFVCHPQVEIGSSASAFEKSVQESIAISLGGTRYGGSIDLATGVMTVTWAGKVLDGTEAELSLMSPAGDARLAYNLTQAGLPPAAGGSPYSVCSHAAVYNPGNAGTWGEFCVRASGYFMMQDKSHVIGTTVDAYRTWLAAQYANETPVTFAYALATPYIVHLAPVPIAALPQTERNKPRINIVYTDAEAVEVLYVKSPYCDADKKPEPAKRL